VGRHGQVRIKPAGLCGQPIHLTPAGQGNDADRTGRQQVKRVFPD
jgi:hypothetical protein